MIEETEHGPSPFPLDGGRGGDGGDPVDGRAPLRPRHADGAIPRARRLRRQPTVGERLLWADLRKLGLNLRRQAPIGRYVVDFVHFESRLVIELDGPVHDRPEVAARDAVRDAWLAGQGFRILRFEARRAIDDREPLVEAIRSAILSPPSQPFPHQGGRALWRARDQWVRDTPSLPPPPSRSPGMGDT